MDSSRTRTARLLIVEDEALIAADLADALEQQGFSIVGIVGTGSAARAAAVEHRPDLTLLDIHLRGRQDGVEVARELRRHELPFVFLTANSDPGTLSRAEAVEPYGYLVKPFDERTLHATVRMALYRAQAEAERRQRRAMMASAVDRIERPVIGVGRDGTVRWTNAPAHRAGADRGAMLVDALARLGRPELVQSVRDTMAEAPTAEIQRDGFQLVPAGDGFVVVLGPPPDAPLCLCAWCQKARDTNGDWQDIEAVLKERFNLALTHGICQDCVDTHFSDFVDPA